MNYLIKTVSTSSSRFIIPMLLFCFIGNSAMAQKPWVRNMDDYDSAPLHFGFALGINNADFKIKRSGDFKFLDSLYTVNSDAQSGLNLGIITNLRLGNYFDFRFIPALSFASRNLEYNLEVNGVEQKPILKKIESSFIDLPVEIKFKSERVHNYRFYVTGGGKYSIDLVSQEKVKNEDRQLVKLSRADYGYQFGLGMDIYFELFKFSPEIKMYQGINNVLVSDDVIFARSLDRLSSRIFLISFNFE